MARPRKQTYTLDMYLKKNRKGDIDNNADVQRNFVWNNEQINELIVTVLTDDYIPPVILGEENDSKLHIVDGGCRTAALRRFREMNYKITSSIENSIIPYKKKIVNKNGNVIYEDALCDIKGKTYEKLPEELKEKFDEYQIETVIHECCDSSKISGYIKRYNNHVAMNTDQKAFTYIDKFANCIRKIIDSKFFIECNNYSEKDKTKGVVERIVVETIMCMNHFNNWKKQPKAACKYLNDHATVEEFVKFEDNLHRLEQIITGDIKDIFNKKDSFIFLTLFDKFTKLGIDDDHFSEFLREFQRNFRHIRKNNKGLLFDEIDKELSTKDKLVIIDKLDLLEEIMLDFLHINKGDMEEVDIIKFVKENVNPDTTQEDVDFYSDVFDDLTLNIDNNTKLLDAHNRPSCIALVGYACNNDIDLDRWMIEFFETNHTYMFNQRENLQIMIQSLENFIKDT